MKKEKQKALSYETWSPELDSCLRQPLCVAILRVHQSWPRCYLPT